MALQSYIFDASKGETPESLAQRRQLADTIASRIFGSAPKNVGEGLNALGQAFIARSMRDETDAAQKAGMASIPPWLGGTGSPAASPASSIASMISGQPGSPSVATPPAIAVQPAGNLPAMRAPAQDTTGKIYSNDEPSPLDPPSGADREAMIQTILGEASNEPQLGKNAVASVIRTRAVDGGYGGDTPLGVVQAPNQFEPWNTAQGRTRMAAAASDPKQRAAADAAIASAYGEGGRAPEDPTEGMTHFYSPAGQAAMGRQPPKWAGGESVTIGGHVFNSPDDAPGAAPVQIASNAAVPIPNATGTPQAAPIPNATGTPQAALLAGSPNDPAALPPNAQPTQGALPTAQAVQTASQPTAPRSQNYGGPFPNVSTADLTKAAFNPWVKASSPVAAQALTAEIARRAQMDQQASDPLRALDIQQKQTALAPVGKPYHDTDGNLVQKDALGKVTVLSAADKAPTSVSEYKYYRDNFQPTPQQPQPMDYATFSTAKSRAGATNISNNVDLNGSQSYDKQLAEGLGKAHVALATGVEDAQTRARDIAAMQGAIDQIQKNGGTTGGMGQQQILDLKKTINSGLTGLGITTPFSENDISDKEFLTKFNRSMAGAQAKNAVGSRVTNFEMSNYLKANPGLDMSITGNQRLLGIQAQMEQRNINVGNAIRSATAEAIANGKKINPQTVEKIIRDYDDQHHITDPVNGQDLTQSYVLPEFQKQGSNASLAVGHEQNINGIKIKRIN